MLLIKTVKAPEYWQRLRFIHTQGILKIDGGANAAVGSIHPDYRIQPWEKTSERQGKAMARGILFPVIRRTIISIDRGGKPQHYCQQNYQ
jgi:hypothetical protein